MKLCKKIIVSSIALAFAAQFSTLTAKSPIDQQLIDNAMPMVVKASDGLFVDVPFIANLVTMNVRVYNSQNELVFSERSKGELIGLLAGDLADGEYRYEAVTVFQLDTPVGHGPSFSDEGMSRDFGAFTIDDGLIVDGNQAIQQNINKIRDDASLLDRMIKQAVNLAGVTLDVLIPSAQAADVTASSSTPSVLFDDTNDEDCSPTWDWRIYAEGGASDGSTANTYRLTGTGEIAGPCGSDVRIFQFGHDGTNGSSSSIDSLIVDPNGNIHFANGTLNLDKSLQNMAIGWTKTSDGNLSISDIKPHVWFHDETDTAEADWQLNEATVKFWSRPSDVGFWRVPLNFNVNAPENSLSINSSGDAGFGTAFPDAALEVTRSDGTSQIRVEETGSSATRTLFHLLNPGRTHFKIENTDAATQWVFTNTGSAFFISLQGTGSPEFKILNNGNAVLAGTLMELSDVNSKTEITEIDPQEILSLVSALPVTKWEYKDARGEAHIGPMAQDFYAAFGLGGSETGIANIDSTGVALAAIKALNEQNLSLKQQNLTILEQNSEILARMEKLERQQSRMQAVMADLIEIQQATPVLTKTAMN